MVVYYKGVHPKINASINTSNVLHIERGGSYPREPPFFSPESVTSQTTDER